MADRGAGRPARATEAQCEDTIIRAARLLGWRVHAERAASSRKGYRTPIKGDAGFPDLVMVHQWPELLLFVELKRKPNRVDPAQLVWLDMLAVSGCRAFVLWVPDEQQAFIDVLATVAESHRPDPLDEWLYQRSVHD